MALPERKPWALIGSVGLITAIAGGLRFYALARQGFWYDEGFSVFLVHQTPGRMLGFLPITESTPPLYYLCAWVWSRLFGMGEVGLRSLSALAGTATVPVLYMVGRRLGSHRSGLALAAFAACNPLLVWYSQEARAYAMLVLLSALSLLFFLRSWSRPAPLDLAAWAIASALAVTTHYMAALTVVPEALFLAYRFRRRPTVLGAVGAVFAAGAALLPLVAEQHTTRRTVWILKTSLGFRLGQFGTHLVSGFDALTPASIAAVAGLGLAVLLLLRAGPEERRGATLAAAIGTTGIALAIGLALAGFDEVITRNLLAVWAPLAAAAAVGLGARRSGIAGIGLILIVCVAWTTVNARVLANPSLQRPDWRKVLHALGPVRTPRLLVLQRYGTKMPLFVYDPTLRRLSRSETVAVKEVDAIAAQVPVEQGCWWGAACNLKNALPPRAPSGLTAVERIRLPNFRIVRFRSHRPVEIRLRPLRREIRHLMGGTVLLQAPRARANPRLSGAA